MKRARFNTYVCHQASAERNYHIFYQLCASRELPEMRSLKLGKTPSQAPPSSSDRIWLIYTFCPYCIYNVRGVCMRPDLLLRSPDAPENFRYTNQGGEMQIPGTDDLSDLERTRSAFTILGI